MNVLKQRLYFSFLHRNEFAYASSDKLVYIRQFSERGAEMTLSAVLQGHEAEVTQVSPLHWRSLRGRYRPPSDFTHYWETAIYPSSNKTLTLTSYLWQNDGLGEGWVGRLEDPWIFGWVSKRFLKPLPREIFDLPQRLNPSIIWSALHCWCWSTPKCDSFSLLFVQVVLVRFFSQWK